LRVSECGSTERDMEGVGEAVEAVGSAVYSFVATSTCQAFAL